MWIQFALAARELWRLLAESYAAQVDGGSYRASVWALAAMSSGAAVFYLGRWIAFLVVGAGEPPFTTVFGEAVTTLITTALLATVSFGMSTLSEEQQKAVLRDAAHRDALTGLLNRSGRPHAELALHAGKRHGTSGSLIIADLDHFKQVNDVHGHQAGDHALVAFADACRSAVRVQRAWWPVTAVRSSSCCSSAPTQTGPTRWRARSARRWHGGRHWARWCSRRSASASPRSSPRRASSG